MGGGTGGGALGSCGSVVGTWGTDVAGDSVAPVTPGKVNPSGAKGAAFGIMAGAIGGPGGMLAPVLSLATGASVCSARLSGWAFKAWMGANDWLLSLPTACETASRALERSGDGAADDTACDDAPSVGSCGTVAVAPSVTCGLCSCFSISLSVSSPNAFAGGDRETGPVEVSITGDGGLLAAGTSEAAASAAGTFWPVASLCAPSGSRSNKGCAGGAPDAASTSGSKKSEDVPAVSWPPKDGGSRIICGASMWPGVTFGISGRLGKPACSASLFFACCCGGSGAAGADSSESSGLSTVMLWSAPSSSILICGGLTSSSSCSISRVPSSGLRGGGADSGGFSAGGEGGSGGSANLVATSC